MIRIITFENAHEDRKERPFHRLILHNTYAVKFWPPVVLIVMLSRTEKTSSKV